MARDCYKEILRLKDMLDAAAIPYECGEHSNGIDIKYPNREKPVCSAVEHDYSYGGRADQIEIMGLLTESERKYDSVLGYLTAEDVFARIKSHWEADNGE